METDTESKSNSSEHTLPLVENKKEQVAVEPSLNSSKNVSLFENEDSNTTEAIEPLNTPKAEPRKRGPGRISLNKKAAAATTTISKSATPSTTTKKRRV